MRRHLATHHAGYILLTLLGFTAFPAASYQEAPMLRARVEAGELPPVEERLPKEPAVVEPVHEIGRYGGTWSRLMVNAGDVQIHARLGYEPLVRWDRTGRKVVPGVAKGWEILEDGKVYVFHLREGMCWSDGAPFTAHDIAFVFNEIYTNKELSPVYPSNYTVDGVPVKVTVLDETTVEFRFVQPYGIFLELLAYRPYTEQMQPKHYLKQFLPAYTPMDELQEMAHAANFDHWFQLMRDRMSAYMNPDWPGLGPFALKVAPPAQRVIAERNPYYYKVDPKGNQLPYIDRMIHDTVQNEEILNIRAMTGQVDFQNRRIDPTNFSLFMENRDRGGYEVLRDMGPGSYIVNLCLSNEDPVFGPLVRDRRFRIALSVAINRAEICDLIFSGMAEPSRGVASSWDPYYLPEFEQPYIGYDPARAEALLDELGMERRGGTGMRTLPNGERFRPLLQAFAAEAGSINDMWQLVVDYWREVGLDFTLKPESTALSLLQVRNNNSPFWAYMNAGMHWVIDPVWYVPWTYSSYFAPAYGRYVSTDGKSGIKPPPEYQQLVDWYVELRSTVDEDRKLELGRNILRQWSEECYVIGIVRNELLTLVANGFNNVPDTILHDYRVMTPGYIGIEQFYFDEGRDE